MNIPIKKKYFGTDGVRGRIGGSVITPDRIMQFGWAAGKVLAGNNSNTQLLIGKDTRISGYMFESALEAGLSAAGINIGLLGPLPTPAVAFLTRSTGSQGGIVISASHNPYYDNGIKFFHGDGTKLSDETELLIEKMLTSKIKTVSSRYLGKAIRISDAPRRYIEFCKSKIREYIKFRNLRIAIDCANGAAYHIAPTVFSELEADITVIGDKPNGLNINHECGATDLKALQKLVQTSHADIGIALDGDGDRLMMIDHEGNIVDGDEILFVLTQLQKEQLNGAVVGTVMSNAGLELALREAQLKLLRTPVGDRYVNEELRKKGLSLGGETSGHIINLNLTTTGDGIIAALMVLQTMLLTDKSLKEICAEIAKLPQAYRNVDIGRASSNTVLADHSLNMACKDIEDCLRPKNGRVVLRPSGTEPLIRIMVEGEKNTEIDEYADQLANKVKEVSLNK